MRSFLALFLAFSLHAAPVPIFDGKTLAGWEGDAAWWRVEDGEIRGGSATVKVPKNFFLATEKSYQNFDLRLKLRLTGTQGLERAISSAGGLRWSALDAEFQLRARPSVVGLDLAQIVHRRGAGAEVV